MNFIAAFREFEEDKFVLLAMIMTLINTISPKLFQKLCKLCKR